ncbi:General transcription factor IIH subunit 2 [Chlorella vulgaris]
MAGRAATLAEGRGMDLDEEDEELRADEEARRQTAFEREYEDDHSWEELEEDEFGNLRAPDRAEEQRARRRRLMSAAASARIRRGMVRYVEVVLDLSRAAALADMRPLRAAVMSGVLQQFVRTFFDENPLSQLGLVILRNGVAERLTELSSSPEAHIAKLRQNLDTGGDASLQNALDLCVDALKSIPPYGHREVLIMLAALSTCDPGDINASIKAAKRQRVRVSVVGLAAEVYVCRRMTEQTGGTYTVATGEGHLQELMLSHAVPPPAAPGTSSVSLVRMGFPCKNPEAPGAAAFCGETCLLRPGGYTCPKCKARVAELPSLCHVCGLSLVASPHLARSYHHLFPVPAFAELPAAELPGVTGCGGNQPDFAPAFVTGRTYCYGCYTPLGQQAGGAGRSRGAASLAAAGIVSRCPDCRHLYCFECDSYIHEHLHTCPGCECLPPHLATATAAAAAAAAAAAPAVFRGSKGAAPPQEDGQAQSGGGGRLRAAGHGSCKAVQPVLGQQAQQGLAGRGTEVHAARQRAAHAARRLEVRQQVLRPRERLAASGGVFADWRYVKHSIPIHLQPLQQISHAGGVVLRQYTDGVARGVLQTAAANVQLQITTGALAADMLSNPNSFMDATCRNEAMRARMAAPPVATRGPAAAEGGGTAGAPPAAGGGTAEPLTDAVDGAGAAAARRGYESGLRAAAGGYFSRRSQYLGCRGTLPHRRSRASRKPMSSSDFARSQKRLEDRGKDVLEKARQKIERERAVAARQAAREAAREEERRLRRVAQEAAEEQERLEHAAELEANNGVLYRAELVAVPAPQSIAADKGIKRAADKILLPPSAGTSLMNQDAFKNGPMYFRLTNAAGNRTHAGLLEFSAAEGFIALPLKVIRSLWGPNATEEHCTGRLQVAYRRLPKGERAVFQPRSASFQQDVGEDIRGVLEAALLQHSCLTQGDWLSVQHGGQQYDLRICELHPEPAVSVIDTDLEAEINPSLETEEKIREEYEAAARRAAEAALATAAAAEKAEAEAAAAEQERLQREAYRLGKEQALPAEPQLESPEPVVTCLFRFPDGSRHSRRFPLSSPLQLLFDFVDANGASSMAPGSYSLVTQYPRRVYSLQQRAGSTADAAAAAAGEHEQPTLQMVGLTGPREVLFLEQQQQQEQQELSGNDTLAGKLHSSGFSPRAAACLARVLASKRSDDPVVASGKLIAAWRALESMEPRALFIDAFAGALAGTEAVREALSLARPYLSPGSAQHVEQRRFCFSNVASRVWWFDRQLEAALGASAGGASSRAPRQVVVLGAGMDSRPWRMKLPAGVRWLEADLPSVASAKREQLEQLGAGFEPGQACSHPLRAASWAIMPADLSQPGWTKALIEAGLDCNQPIVWVAEGLLMYLSNDQVTALLREMAEVSPSGSRLILHQTTDELLTLTQQGPDAAPAYAPFPPELVATWKSSFPSAANRAELAARLSTAGWPHLQQATSRAGIAAQIAASQSGEACSSGSSTSNGGGAASASNGDAAAMAAMFDFETQPDVGRDRWAVFLTASK